ncbi:hypothetical protein RV11_GL002976 [Enterococcus phoeniculicola]|nr:hypothetical protein RV11_GL002976 [Enterococcus phoeniculicola]
MGRLSYLNKMKISQYIGGKFMKICKNCGHENLEGSLFCESCGASLAEETNAANQSENPQAETSETTELHTENSVEEEVQETSEAERNDSADSLEEKSEEMTEPVFEATDGETSESATEATTDDKTESQETAVPDETKETPVADSAVENGQADQGTEAPEQKTSSTAKTSTGTFSKKQLTIGAIVVAVLLLLFAGYKYGTSVYTSEKQVETFVQAIKDKDSKALVALMITDDDNLEITESSVKPLIKYFNGNKKALAEMKKEMKQNLRTYNLEMKKSGKKFLVFDNYKVEVYPVYPEVSTNQKGTIISVNDKKYTTTKKDKFKEELGPFVPGTYTFSATAKNLTESNESKEETYDLFNVADTEIDLTFAVMTIPIESNIDDAKIFVDGKEAGQLKDGEGEVGPLVWHEGLTIQLTSGSGDKELKSEAYEVDEWEYSDEYDSEYDYPLYLDFDVLDSYDIEYAIDDFYYEVEDAVIESNKYDKELLGKYFKDGTKNESFKKIDEYITSSREKNKKNEFDGVWFYVEVKKVTPLENDQYEIDYEVSYHNYGSKVEDVTYKYTGVKVTAIEDDSYSIDFEFIDLGDGGKKVEN